MSDEMQWALILYINGLCGWLIVNLVGYIQPGGDLPAERSRARCRSARFVLLGPLWPFIVFYGAGCFLVRLVLAAYGKDD